MFSRLLPKFPVLIIAAVFVHCAPHYDVPKAQFEVFYPRGFRVSIPAEEGISFFAFHRNSNVKMEALEAEQWAKDIVKPEEGRYWCTNWKTPLKIGDIIYYSIYVIYNGFGYHEDDRRFIVTEYVNKSTVDDLEESKLLSGIGGGGGEGGLKILNPGHRIKTCNLLSGIGGEGREDDPISLDPAYRCKRSVTVVNGLRQECAECLIFEEEFESHNLDITKWTRQRRFGTHPDYEFVTYLANDEVLFTRQNNLVIKPKRLTSIYGNRILRASLNMGINCTGDVGTNDCKREYSPDILPPIIAGQISSKGHFHFLYGTIKIRAKLPNILWAYPQLFLDPTENVYGKYSLSSGQMRLAMTRGSETCDLLGGVILHSSEQFRNLKMCNKRCENKDYSSDFHEYELKWTPDLITVSVDGEQFCFITPESGFGYLEADGERLPTADLLNTQSKMAPFDRPFHITLGLGVGGHSDFPDDTPSKPWTNKDPRAMLMYWNSVKNSNYPLGEMLVDYVKVYTV